MLPSFTTAAELKPLTEPRNCRVIITPAYHPHQPLGVVLVREARGKIRPQPVLGPCRNEATIQQQHNLNPLDGI